VAARAATSAIEAAHVHALRVPFYLVDAGGGVYHGNYFALFETAREAYLREAGFPYTALMATGHHLTVAECRVRYLSPLLYDDDIAIETDVVKLGRRSFTVRQRVRRGGELTTEAALAMVCIDRQGRPAPLPEKLREALG